eukprot:evm.model.scf_4.11 EVM.evm.TU.scf_4.11   scf_4:301627-302136(-)
MTEDSASPEIVRDLLSRGADPNADLSCCLDKFNADKRAMFSANCKVLHGTTLNDNSIVAAALVEAGANVSARCDGGWAPLHRAAIHNAEGVAGVLLDAGADVGALDWFGDTALHEAAGFGSLEVAKLLVSRGASTGAENTSDQTPGDRICDKEDFCDEEVRKELEDLLL